MQLSSYGEGFLGDKGILQLMQDLGEAVQQDGVIQMGGGNPAQIPEVQVVFRERMQRIMSNAGEFESLISSYDAPGGGNQCIEALSRLFQEQCNWDVCPENIVLTNGSQTGFFMLFNLLAGDSQNGKRKILLPLAPEYIGYADVGISPNMFVSNKPVIVKSETERTFKYSVDFSTLKITSDIAAICVSRPTNPTGNVLSEEEMAKLSSLAKQHNIPLIVDNAYGVPFPGIVFADCRADWQPHIVMCMSLSKLGLPGARTGIIVADKKLVQGLVAMNAVICLAPNSFGPALTLDIIRSGQILQMSRDIVMPYYRKKSDFAMACLQREMQGLDAWIHQSDGAIFLWVWFRNLPISDDVLYKRLKSRGVLVVPGHYFFPGLNEDWQHKHECMRINYSGEKQAVEAGCRIIAEEARKAYGGN